MRGRIIRQLEANGLWMCQCCSAEARYVKNIIFFFPCQELSSPFRPSAKLICHSYEPLLNNAFWSSLSLPLHVSPFMRSPSAALNIFVVKTRCYHSIAGPCTSVTPSYLRCFKRPEVEREYFHIQLCLIGYIFFSSVVLVAEHHIARKIRSCGAAISEGMRKGKKMHGGQWDSRPVSTKGWRAERRWELQGQSQRFLT